MNLAIVQSYSLLIMVGTLLAIQFLFYAAPNKFCTPTSMMFPTMLPGTLQSTNVCTGKTVLKTFSSSLSPSTCAYVLLPHVLTTIGKSALCSIGTFCLQLMLHCMFSFVCSCDCGSTHLGLWWTSYMYMYSAFA